MNEAQQKLSDQSKAENDFRLNDVGEMKKLQRDISMVRGKQQAAKEMTKILEGQSEHVESMGTVQSESSEAKAATEANRIVMLNGELHWFKTFLFNLDQTVKTLQASEIELTGKLHEGNLALGGSRWKM